LSVYGLRQQSRMMKLGDVVEYLPKKFKLKAGDAKENGKYRFYSSSQDKIMYYDEYEFEHKCILLGRGGLPSVHLAEKFCISHDDVYVLRPKININIMYIYFYLFNNKNLLHFTGNGLKHLSKENINIVEIPIPPLNIQQQIINKINLLNTQSSHYEIYAQTLQQEIDHIMETIQNMCSNSTNSTDTKTDNKLSDKSAAKQTLNDLGLEDAPDIEQLLSDVNDELESGYDLLNKLNINGSDKSDFDTDIDTDQLINRVSKPKISKSKHNQQMIARAVN
jgi:hypothetical protein